MNQNAVLRLAGLRGTQENFKVDTHFKTCMNCMKRPADMLTQGGRTETASLQIVIADHATRHTPSITHH